MVRASRSAVLAANVLLLVAGKGRKAARDLTGYDFDAFLAEHGKSYGEGEREHRQALFEANLRSIIEHNSKYTAGEHTWFMGMNTFADWTEEELKQLRSTRPTGPSRWPTTSLSQISEPNPEAVDWREKGAVTPVKNQGACGSCWAFAATETVESHYTIASGKTAILSPQTFVNCVENPDGCGGTGGCGGAIAEMAFNFSVHSGVPLESEVPYKEHDGKCTEFSAVVKATGYIKLAENDAKAVETALANVGPLAVTVAAGAWTFYEGGSYQGCTHKQDADLDHAVQLVGYTKDDWIIRNSWGTGWGEQGFIRLSRASDSLTFVNKNPRDGTACEPYPETQIVGGECGVLFDTAYPTGVAAAAAAEIVV